MSRRSEDTPRKPIAAIRPAVLPRAATPNRGYVRCEPVRRGSSAVAELLL
ncbi:hypothetical protein SAMN04487820_11393 [Actinopolyspora mzabensis]|uniref:Uncharacterized protein n=1 Tax=Actinopolyspora mzabensis TaxID=995066 RepID=A0A1G9EZK9_ACTMZ|nr:hypothetical protein SAMN04487820_11393 [Actinopolyspora mzabensis]